MKMKSKEPNAGLKRYINTKEESGAGGSVETVRSKKRTPPPKKKANEKTSNSEKTNGKRKKIHQEESIHFGFNPLSIYSSHFALTNTTPLYSAPPSSFLSPSSTSV